MRAPIAAALCLALACALTGCQCGEQVVAVQCGPSNCAGCCSLDGVCLAGDADGACGEGGLQCNVCGAQQRCEATRCALIPTPLPDAGPPVVLPDAGPTCQSPARSGDVCGSTGWCWEEPWPMGLQVSAVGGTSSRDLWVGAAGGLLFHFDGSRWSSVPTGVAAAPVSGVFFDATRGVFTAENALYERGDAGFALSLWNENLFPRAPIAVGDALYANSGHVLFQQHRGTWSSVLLSGSSDACFRDELCPISYALRQGSTGLEGFAVGAYGAISQLKSGRFELIAGNATPANGPVLPGLGSVASLGDGGYLATGSAAAKAFSGGAWADVPRPDAGLGAVFAVGQRTFVVGPQSSFFEWDGTFRQQQSPSGRRLSSGFGFGEGDGVAFGDRSLLRFDGQRWEEQVEIAAERAFPGEPSEHALFSVAAAPGAGFAVGQGGLVLQRQGNRWKAVPVGTSAQLYGVWADGCDRAWVVGEKGALLQYDGLGWRSWNSGTTDDLFAVWGLGGEAAELFAVGENGAVLRFDGTTWSRQNTPTRRTLAAIWGSDAQHVWAAGQDGALLFYDGTSWSAVQNLPGAFTFTSVTGRSATEVYVGSVEGRILTFNGAAWTQLTPSLGPGLEVYDLFAPPNSRALYAAGRFGVFRYNGLAWVSELSLPFRAAQLAFAEGRLWVVGERSSVLSRPFSP